MKKLKLKNPGYRALLSNFTEWLDILGYAKRTVYGMPIQLQEFFYWLERQGYHDISKVTPKDVKEYYAYLKHRANERRAGGLSNMYLNKHQTALRTFRTYLVEHNAHTTLRVHLKYETNNTDQRNVLTKSEIKELFLATAYSHTLASIRLRDKALLVCLYSCGLRRNEAIQLDIKDILFDKQRIHVRHGKNYRERFVPFNMYSLRILEDYIYEGRPLFYKASESEALFIGVKGTRLSGVTVLDRVHKIVEATGQQSIIDKHISPHILRHSIATHLLQQKVPIESIKTFLGHSSLVSTQIYTHILKNSNDENF